MRIVQHLKTPHQDHYAFTEGQPAWCVWRAERGGDWERTERLIRAGLGRGEEAME